MININIAYQEIIKHINSLKFRLFICFRVNRRVYKLCLNFVVTVKTHLQCQKDSTIPDLFLGHDTVSG